MDPSQARSSLSSDKELGPSANTEPHNQTSTASDSALRDFIALAPKGLSDVFRRSLSRVRSSSTPAFVGKEKKSLDLEKPTSGKDEDPRHPGPSIRKPKNILDLQPELQLMIIELLHFGDILRLRQTCKGYRALTSPAQMRALFGPSALTSEILGHCKVCLERDESRENQLLTTRYDPGYPFSSICIKCALVANDSRLRVGQTVMLGDNVGVWICRWCGWPIRRARGSCPIAQFHPHCYDAFRSSLRRFILLGWIQLSLGIVAAALSWRYFRHAALVFAPTVTSFLLLWFCLAYSFTRHVAKRKYIRLLFLELAILGCWIPPVYYISTVVADYPPDKAIPKPIKASLALFSLNLFFRLNNVLGYIVILSGYNLARRKRPRVSWWRKVTYPVMFWLIHWTHPQSVGESGVLR